MASNIFIKIEGVEGESAQEGFEKQIEVASISWGVSNTTHNVMGGGHSSGKAEFADVQLSKVLDKASPVMMKLCATGTHKKDAVITFLKSTGGPKPEPFLIVTLTAVYVKSLTLSASGDSPVPYESVGLAYEQIKFEYSAQDKTGKLTKAASFDYNLKAAKAAA